MSFEIVTYDHTTDSADFRASLAELKSSSMYGLLYHKAMVDKIESDLFPSFELGAAIFLGLPIVLIIRPEHNELPAKLVQIADYIIEGSTPDEIADALRELHDSLEDRDN